MSLRRLISVLSVVVVSGSVVLAAPKKDAKKKAPPTPVAPAKDDAGSASGSGAGSAVEMQEDAPPSDMNGTDENPDAPKDVSNTPAAVQAPPTAHATGYPIEEVLRPITLPANMSEVTLGGRTDVSPVSATFLLHARYGITSRIQLGLSYVIGGVYDDPATLTSTTKGFHPGKAVGLDVTVLLQNWLAVRVGVPVYVDPVAVGLQLGAPMKFTFGDKFALGGFDDLLNIKLSKFAPSFLSAEESAGYAAGQATNTSTPNGHLRFSIFAEYQHSSQLAIIGRAGVDNVLGSSSSNGAGTSTSGGTATFLRAGLQFSPRKYVDVGGSLGFDDLAHGGSFAPEAYLALRI